jgi:hypothetical protein
LIAKASALFLTLTFLAQSPAIAGDVGAPAKTGAELAKLLKPLNIDELRPKLQFYAEQGVPVYALRRIFDYLKANQLKPLTVQESREETSKVWLNNIFNIAVIDFSRPSTEPRLFLMNLEDGTFEMHYVSHGTATGYLYAHTFSNNFDSHQSSLGMFVTGWTYQSNAFQGTALKIYGLEQSNNNVFERFVVIHPASYASPKFVEDSKKLGYGARLGRSFGCFAVDPQFAPHIIDRLKNGALLFAYDHDTYEPGTPLPPGVNPKPSAKDDRGVDTQIELDQREPRRK